VHLWESLVQLWESLVQLWESLVQLWESLVQLWRGRDFYRQPSLFPCHGAEFDASLESIEGN